MLERLQKKWKVGAVQLLLILCTFAIGGSLTGYVSKKVMNLLPLDGGWPWVVVYIIILTLLWPLAVLLISVFFGQFRFFSGYLKKMGARIGLVKKSSILDSLKQPVNIAIFASGAGSNAKKIIEHFRDSRVQVVLIVTNKPGAGVLRIAADNKIPTLLIDKERFFRGDGYVQELQNKNVQYIILAGFLWKIPLTLISAFTSRIINIHPALLPKYGGKGMYGNFVHEAVIAAGETESGITIHYVDDKYDHGAIIFQTRCPVLKNDSAESLAQRIHALEHEHFPVTIEKLLSK
jgi:phosphoribosylglycinamide formyltransferase 1